MSNQPTNTVYFYPDPFGTGEAVTVEATDRQDADKQLKKLQDQRQKTQESPQELPQETPPAEQPLAEAVEPEQEGKTR